MGDGEELTNENSSPSSHESAHDHWFEPLAEHMGAAFLRYSFTKGTVQEVDALERLLDLSPGMSILDVGCGPGRHALEFARRGYRVTGIDISDRFVQIANDAARVESLDASFIRHDARELPGRWGSAFDVVVCLCQGGFGLMVGEGEDENVFAGAVASLKPGGSLALSAFNAYFAVKHFGDASFDAGRGLSIESTEVRDVDGRAMATTLWTGCYTPRELRLLAHRHHLEDVRIHGVEPGAYGEAEPSLDLPEFLLLAQRASQPH